MLTLPTINPVFFEWGIITLHWYGLMYVLGIFLGGWVLYRPFKTHINGSFDVYVSMITTVCIGIVMGGRLGYVVIYNWAYYSQNLYQILWIWQGGMSYHGGLVGAIVATTWVAYKQRIAMWTLWDWLGLGSTIGLFFGRIGNFINGELYGRVTTVSWGFIFPNGGPLPRHPSQLYEAFSEGFLLGMILWFFSKKYTLKTGQLASLYLIFYGFFRFCCEFFREPDPQFGLLFYLSMGQWLCFSMMVLGGVLFWYRGTRPQHDRTF